jgi:hypothetical protein
MGLGGRRRRGVGRRRSGDGVVAFMSFGGRFWGGMRGGGRGGGSGLEGIICGNGFLELDREWWRIFLLVYMI